MSQSDTHTDLPLLSRAAYSESDILHAADLQQDGQSLATGQYLHNSQAHGAGVVAGFHRLTLTKGLDNVPLATLDCGAAMDSQGRLLLWDGSESFKADWPNDAHLLDLWIYQLDENSSSAATNDDHDGNLYDAGGDSQKSMPRVQVQLGIDVQPTNKRPVAFANHVFLGTYQATIVEKTLTANYQSGRTYVGARGGHIESCSGDTRILLGPDQPRDMRRFAITCKDGDTYRDVLSWETNHTLNLHAPAFIQRENSERTEVNIGGKLRFAGAAKAADTIASPWSMQLVELEQDGKLIEELRIAIGKPDDETQQLRSRCSLGRATLDGTDSNILQQGESLGVLSVLADGSVEVINNLWVFSDREGRRPGLILKTKAKDEAEQEVSSPRVLTDVMRLAVSAVWSADKGAIHMTGNVSSARSIHTVRLLVTLIDLSNPNIMPASKDFTLLDIVKPEVPSHINIDVSLPDKFSTNVRLEFLVLGITPDSHIAQCIGQATPQTATA